MKKYGWQRPSPAAEQSIEAIRKRDQGIQEWHKPTGASTLTMAELAERGWTVAMVSRLLGDPDAVMRHPRNRSAQVRLWLTERVKAAEITGEWAAALDAAQRRAKRKSEKLAREEQVR